MESLAAIIFFKAGTPYDAGDFKMMPSGKPSAAMWPSWILL